AAAQPVAMPADDGVRLHDNQRSAPVPPKSREGHPEESVARLEAASRRSVVRRQLLPQREVFQDQFPVAAKHQRDCADDDDRHHRRLRTTDMPDPGTTIPRGYRRRKSAVGGEGYSIDGRAVHENCWLADAVCGPDAQLVVNDAHDERTVLAKP